MFLFWEFCSFEETIIRNVVNKLFCTEPEMLRHNLSVQRRPAEHRTWAALWLARCVWSVLALKTSSIIKQASHHWQRIPILLTSQPWSKQALNVNKCILQLLLLISPFPDLQKRFEIAVPSHTRMPETLALFKPNLALTEAERENCRDKALIKVSSGRWSSLSSEPSAKTRIDRVSRQMKGLLLIPWSSDDGKRSRDRGGIWFPLQISKLKTNYPHDLKWWRQKPTTYFHPKLILSFVCCVKFELMAGKAFKLSF